MMGVLEIVGGFAFSLCCLFYIGHTGKALRNGVFVGWYKGSWQDFYVYRAAEPWRYWFNLLLMSIVGAGLLAIGVIILDDSYLIFERLGLTI
jgi:hypothetical protein